MAAAESGEERTVVGVADSTNGGWRAGVCNLEPERELWKKARAEPWREDVWWGQVNHKWKGTMFK